MLSKHWDHPTVYPMILKLLITRGNITLIPKEASHSTHMQASRPPYVYVACQELLVDMPSVQAELYLRKLTTSHFGTLNTRIANQNVLKMILIAMRNENKADCNENFTICAEEPIAPLYKW